LLGSPPDGEEEKIAAAATTKADDDVMGMMLDLPIIASVER